MEYKKLLNEYDDATQTTAEKIIASLKANCSTYGDLQRKFNQLKEAINFTYGLSGEYSSLLVKLEFLINKEKNDLPLTNRSDNC